MKPVQILSMGIIMGQSRHKAQFGGASVDSRRNWATHQHMMGGSDLPEYCICALRE
jgi:hypothetical protein